jgi:membrane protease YdiL (CAAX protease family)
MVAELLLVLAVFPLPYAVSAVIDLVNALVGNGSGQRTPVLIKGHAAASFGLELVLILVPFAAAGLVAYLLSISGPFASRGGVGAAWTGSAPATGRARGEGGLRALGLDFSRLRGDFALVIVVFLLCEVIPIYGGGLLLRAFGVHGVTPSTSGGPGYFLALDILIGITSGVVEEIVVLGYLVRRLEQLALPGWAVVAIAVAVRGSYHLYYGWGVLPILAWATVSVVLYRRYRRLLPFIVVHVLWDTSLFIAASMPTKTGGLFLVAEAGLLVPVSFVLWLVWRNRMPLPRSTRAR